MCPLLSITTLRCRSRQTLEKRASLTRFKSVCWCWFGLVRVFGLEHRMPPHTVRRTSKRKPESNLGLRLTLLTTCSSKKLRNYYNSFPGQLLSGERPPLYLTLGHSASLASVMCILGKKLKPYLSTLQFCYFLNSHWKNQRSGNYCLPIPWLHRLLTAIPIPAECADTHWFLFAELL